MLYNSLYSSFVYFGLILFLSDALALHFQKPSHHDLSLKNMYFSPIHYRAQHKTVILVEESVNWVVDYKQNDAFWTNPLKLIQYIYGYAVINRIPRL